MKKNNIKFLIKVIAAVFFIYLILHEINWRESLTYLQKIKVQHVVAYVAVLILGMLLSAFKWKILANHKNFQLPFREFFKLYITGAFINNYVPSTIGGDIFRAVQLGKGEKRYSEATATVVMDRFTGLLSLMIMTPFFSLLNCSRISQNPTLLAINGIILGLLVAFLIFILIRRQFWVKKLMNLAPDKLGRFLRELAGFGDDPKIFLLAMAYSFAFNLFGVALANAILFLGLGVSINLIDYLSVIFIISIISAIPAGFGLKEWSYVVIFGFFGANPSATIMVALLNRFLQALVNIAAFPIYLKSKKK